MLKIKDNVDLKELEKLGYEKHKYIKEYYSKGIEHFSGDFEIIIYVDDRVIEIKGSTSFPQCEGYASTEILSILYDLIKRDWVEEIDYNASLDVKPIITARNTLLKLYDVYFEEMVRNELDTQFSIKNMEEEDAKD